MKRTISILVLLTLLICLIGSAMADPFTLHSKVIFGMTPDEVSSYEKDAGFTLSDKEIKYGTSKAKLAKIVEGTIAGLAGSEIHYYFDKDNNLYSATYWLGSIFNSTRAEYESLDAALVKKYGASSDIYLPIVERIGFESNDYLSEWGLSRKNSKVYPQYSSWLIQQDDGSYVAIVHYYESATVMGIDMTFHILGYQLYSADEINNELNTINNEIDQRNDDI